MYSICFNESLAKISLYYDFTCWGITITILIENNMQVSVQKHYLKYINIK